MKKILFIALALALAFGLWKYLAKQSTEPSVAKDIKDTVENTANYVPNVIETKNQAQQKINDSLQKENDRLKATMEQLP